MRERLSYSLWREMGVATVRNAPVGVEVATETRTKNIGLHLLTEVRGGVRHTQFLRI